MPDSLAREKQEKKPTTNWRSRRGDDPPPKPVSLEGQKAWRAGSVVMSHCMSSS